MKTIQFKRTSASTIITIPDDLIKHVAETNPDSPLIIHNKKSFATHVAFELQHNLGNSESGLSGLEELIDNAIMAVAEDGHEFVDFKENE